MRIVSGIYGGRKLEAPKNDNIRPTSDKVRGAVFNILRGLGAVEGASVLDAFCGSGALGLEALSQGADHCTFVDKHPKSLNLCQSNARNLGVQDADFILKDACKLPAQERKFDLIFLDPPYNKNLIPTVLTHLSNINAIAQNATVMIETEKSWNTALLEDYLSIETQKTYGHTQILICTKC